MNKKEHFNLALRENKLSKYKELVRVMDLYIGFLVWGEEYNRDTEEDLTTRINELKKELGHES
jgi:hypothetical protein